ncbi:DUF6889 family protein [Morganella psychrotolerans]|nr:hypothetical protein [Morganella psychrotolerans]
MRPVGKGMCRYESLLDGTLALADIALMNDYLDVEAENEATIERYKNEQR